MIPTFLLASLLAVGTVGAAPAVEVQSPSGDLVLTVGTGDFGDERGCPFYRLGCKGRTVLTDSRLGLDLEPDALAANLEITSVARSRQDATWRPVSGEREVVRDRYNAARIDLMERGPRRRLLRLNVRVYDEGGAFCYTIPEQPNVEAFTIGAERTQFAFAADHNAWAVYRAGPLRRRAGADQPDCTRRGAAADGRAGRGPVRRRHRGPLRRPRPDEAAPRRRPSAYPRSVPGRRARPGGPGERQDALHDAVAGRHGGRFRRPVAGAR